MSSRILLFSKNYPPQIGWIEKYSFDLYNQLIADWNEVFLIKSPPRIMLFYRYKYIYIFYEIIRLWFFLCKSIFFGITLIPKIDIVWSADWSIGFLWFFLTLFKNVKTRVTLHGKDFSWNAPGYQHFLHFILWKTDEVHVVSSFLYQKVKEKFPDLSSKLYLKEHTQRNLSFHPKINFDVQLFYKKYNIPQDKVCLFSLWRFVSKKWFDWFLAEVLPLLDSRFHYVIGGFWPLEDKILEYINLLPTDSCTFVGPIIENDEKMKFYTSMDYFVMPNIEQSDDLEWFGIVLLEAQFYWLKCILSDANGLSFRSATNDIILPCGDAQAWSKCINNL